MPPRKTLRDPLVWPVLWELRNCAHEQLGKIARPVAAFPLYFADHFPPAMECDCEGNQGARGAGWVRQVIGRGSGGGAASLPASCAGGMVSVTVEVGVYRCAPVFNSIQAPNPDAVMDQWVSNMQLDQTALLRTFTCCHYLAKQDIPYTIGDFGAIGPSGGCVGVYVQAQLSLTLCGC